MNSLTGTHQFILFVLIYLLSLGGVLMLNRREFKRNPEKGARYEALPLHYKLACWLIVVPLFAVGVLQPALFFASIVAFMAVEAACVRWYRKSGLLP